MNQFKQTILKRNCLRLPPEGGIDDSDYFASFYDFPMELTEDEVASVMFLR